MNEQAAKIFAQITAGVTKLGMVGRPDIAVDLVVRITEKSVYFADGSYTNKRSLHRFYVAN
jgi:hypothetical protein